MLSSEPVSTLCTAGIEPSEDDFEKIELLELDYPAELTVEQLVSKACSHECLCMTISQGPQFEAVKQSYKVAVYWA